MCTPLAMVAGIGVAQSVAGFVSSQAQYRTQKDLYRKNAALAERAADLELRGIRTRQLQERAAASAEIEGIAREVMQRGGTARVAALEAGAGGEVARMIDRDFTSQGLTLTQGALTNLGFVEGQLELDATAARARQEGRALDALPRSKPFILEPLLGAALSIAEADAAAVEGSGFLGLGGA